MCMLFLSLSQMHTKTALTHIHSHAHTPASPVIAVTVLLTGALPAALEAVTVILYTSGKNHFHEMNGDVGMAGWK